MSAASSRRSPCGVMNTATFFPSDRTTTSLECTIGIQCTGWFGDDGTDRHERIYEWVHGRGFRRRGRRAGRREAARGIGGGTGDGVAHSGLARKSGCATVLLVERVQFTHWREVRGGHKGWERGGVGTGIEFLLRYTRHLMGRLRGSFQLTLPTLP